jgi:hypothetical protein
MLLLTPQCLTWAFLCFWFFVLLLKLLDIRWRHQANMKRRCATPRTLASPEYFPSCELIRYLEIQSHAYLEGTTKRYVKYGYTYQTSMFSATLFNTINSGKFKSSLINQLPGLFHRDPAEGNFPTPPRRQNL